MQHQNLTTTESVWSPGINLLRAYRNFSQRRRQRHEQQLRTVHFLRNAGEVFMEQRRASARAAMNGLLLLPGCDRVYFVGTPPRWQQRVVDGNSISGVHRLSHFMPLLQTGFILDAPEIISFAAAQMDDWIWNCPLPELLDDHRYLHENFVGEVPWNTINAAHRVFHGLFPAMDLLAGTEYLDEKRFALWMQSIHDHGRMLDFVPPKMPWGSHSNIFLMQSLGLLACAVAGADFAAHTAWLDTAGARIEACAEQQFTEDGAHIEATPGYHALCVQFMLEADAFLQDTGRRLPDELKRKLEAAVWHTVHATRPTGGCVPTGDCNVGNCNALAPLCAYLAWNDFRPMAVMARFTGLPLLRDFVLNHTGAFSAPEASIQALDEVAAAPLPAAALPPRTAWQRQIKQVSLRTAWNRDAHMLYLNCQTVEKNGHSDQDPCGFDFCALGRALLIDPGRVEYRETEQRRQFRSAAWHNTVTVDHCEPYAYRSQWQSAPPGETGIEFVQDQDGLLATGCYQKNFAPALHRRALVLIDDRALLVLDAFTGLHWAQSVQIYFHFPTPHVRLDAHSGLAVLEGDAVELALHGSYAAEAELLPGEFAPRMGRAYPTARLRLNDTRFGSDAPRLYATLAVPYLTDNGMPMLKQPEICLEDADNYIVSIDIDGHPQRLHWSATGIRRLEKKDA